MPELLVLKNDEIHDRIAVDDTELTNTVGKLYNKLNKNYTIEILYDGHPRAKKR